LYIYIISLGRNFGQQIREFMRNRGNSKARDFLKDYGKKVTQMENFNKNFTRFMVLQ